MKEGTLCSASTKKLNVMKTLLFLLMIGCVIRSSAQGTIHITTGTNIKTTNNLFIVLDNLNVVNNGSFVQAPGDGSTKFTGNINTTTSGTGTTTLDKLDVSISNDNIHTLTSLVSL